MGGHVTSARNAFAESVQDGQRVRMESAVAAPHDGRVRRKVDWWGLLSARSVTTVVLVQSTPASKAWRKKKTREGIAESRREYDRWAQVGARALESPSPRRDHNSCLPHAGSLQQHGPHEWSRIWRNTKHVKHFC